MPTSARPTALLAMCHCEPVTDVTGVAIRSPRPLRRGITDSHDQSADWSRNDTQILSTSVIAKPVRTLAVAIRIPVSLAPLPKGGWHGEAVTGGFFSRTPCNPSVGAGFYPARGRGRAPPLRTSCSPSVGATLAVARPYKHFRKGDPCHIPPHAKTSPLFFPAPCFAPANVL